MPMKSRIELMIIVHFAKLVSSHFGTNVSWQLFRHGWQCPKILPDSLRTVGGVQSTISFGVSIGYVAAHLRS